MNLLQATVRPPLTDISKLVIALKMRLRIRAFPILHQSVVVFGLLAIHEFILFWIDGIAGFPVTDWARWLPVLTGALCWPLLTGLYSRLALRA